MLRLAFSDYYYYIYISTYKLLLRTRIVPPASIKKMRNHAKQNQENEKPCKTKLGKMPGGGHCNLKRYA